jgi:hypothetical protein
MTFNSCLGAPNPLASPFQRPRRSAARRRERISALDFKTVKPDGMGISIQGRSVSPSGQVEHF